MENGIVKHAPNFLPRSLLREIEAFDNNVYVEASTSATEGRVGCNSSTLKRASYGSAYTNGKWAYYDR